MSSRKLLVLLRHAPETGPYKTALRQGDWPDWMQMLKEVHKELALGRAAKYVGGEGEYRPMVFLSPAEQVERAAEQETDDADFEALVTNIAGQ